MPAPPPLGEIPSFNLFGESADLPDVIHCETIASRSQLHQWELKPHRHARLHQVLHILSGGGQARLDASALELGARSLVNVPIGHVHAFRFVPGTQGWVVTLASEMLDEMITHAPDLRRLLSQAAVVPAGRGLGPVMAQIASEFEGRQYGRAQVLRGLSTLLLGLVARSLQGAGHARDAAAAPPLMHRFEALVEAHHAQRWSVADYARALHVSPTHLSRVARQATGRPASRHIDDRVIREARRHLVYTNLQVATIAYALGFADPAHFSRVFQRATGVSPRVFRQQAALA